METIATRHASLLADELCARLQTKPACHAVVMLLGHAMEAIDKGIVRESKKLAQAKREQLLSNGFHGTNSRLRMESAKESLYGLDYVSGLQLLIYSHR